MSTQHGSVAPGSVGARRPSAPESAAAAGQADASPGADVLALYWVPLGAGTSVVRLSGRIYEAIGATLQRRARSALYHAALIARCDGDEVTVEVAPVPDGNGRVARGVVAEGAVGDRRLGRWRVFRYEVRCWSGGVIPDLAYAVASPAIVSTDTDRVTAVLDRLAAVPTPVWGRDELGLGDMWNSNSVVAWTLATSGLDIATLAPPTGGRAPGWRAGLELATRERGEPRDRSAREQSR